MLSAVYTTTTPSKALLQLLHATAKRLAASPPPPCLVLRFPVALVFMRGDRAGEGQKIADQVLASFAYVHADSGDDLDVLLVGWSTEAEKHTFHLGDFLAFRRVIEDATAWTYSGETDLLLLNVELDLHSLGVAFDFSEVVALPLETLLRNKVVDSIDGFLTELTAAARSSPSQARFEGNSPVWHISDNIGFLKAKAGIWNGLKKFFLKDGMDKLEGALHFKVTDLRRLHTPKIHLSLEHRRQVRQALADGSEHQDSA